MVNGKKLTDIHITFSQYLLSKQFLHLNGLQSPVYQLSKPFINLNNVIQVLHIGNDHWAVLFCPSESQIRYYDSVYSTLPFNAEEIISYLLNTNNGRNQIEVNDSHSIPKQSGSTECGLYSIAIATALAYGLDPVLLVFKEDEMRLHLLQCLENRKMEPFPISKTRHFKTTASKLVLIYTCPECKKVKMAQRWFNVRHVTTGTMNYVYLNLMILMHGMVHVALEIEILDLHT